MFEALIQADRQALLWLNGCHSPFFDAVMWFVSGRPEWIPLYLVIVAFVIRKYRTRSVWIIVALVLLIVLSDQLANVLKNSVQRLRPCKDPEIGHLVYRVRNYCGGAYGFVSGHAANSFALATFISLLFRRQWLTISILFWACLVSYSRIYLGVHYPGDVIGGALLGTLLARVLYSLWSLTDGMLTLNRQK